MESNANLPSPALNPQQPDDTSPRCCKRKRELDNPLLPTPPQSPPGDSASTTHLLDRAVHVLSTEAAALGNVAKLYQTEATARSGLIRAVECVVKSHENGGKLIICGIGKSGFVGQKVVATLKSLGIGSSFLHAAEALHGDLGDIRLNDTLLFITFSGKTAEILNVTTHVKPDIPVIVLTSHTVITTCPIVKYRPDAILLPAPIHESEESSFGVSAPTTSTTVAMSVGDMLALCVVDRIHQSVKAVFQSNHPGGALGEMARREANDTE